MASKQPVVVTSKGTLAPAMTRSSVPLANLGTKAADGTIWQHPRLTTRLFGGRSVRVTNPTASGYAANERTASLGIGGVGQRGRTRDVGATAKGEV
jgi:hypothetical protein